MDTDTKRSSIVAGIVEDRKRREAEGEEPREAGKDVRGAIPTPMLDIIQADGSISSFSYAYLTEVNFIPGDTLTLFFGETRVIVDGRNLGIWREKLRLHKADALQEGTEAEDDIKPEQKAHISRIEVERGQDERKETTSETGRFKGHQR